MEIISFCLLSTLLFTAQACEQTEVSKKGATLAESCGADKRAVKTVSSVEGSIGFDSSMQQFFIRRAIPGTYDSVDIGVLCGKIPKNIQVVGARVLFSGTYREYDKQAPTTMGGKKYYYLDLSMLVTRVANKQKLNPRSS